MQPVPVDLILHALAENLIGMEGNDESLRSLGHTILRTCIDTRALPAQWCNGAGVGQQMSWLTRRLADVDTHPHIAAETRAMEVAIARRLADTALSLLITQDDGDKTAAVTLLDAAHRVVGLPGAEVHAEDTASWESRVLALEGQLQSLRESYAAVSVENDAWRDWSVNLGGMQDRPNAHDATLRDAVSKRLFATDAKAVSDLRQKVATLERDQTALRKEADEAIAEAAAHLKDVKTARDEADSLRVKLRQEEAKVLDLEADVERLAECDKRADLYRDHMQEVRAALGILTNASHSDTIKRIADIRGIDSSRPVAERITWIARFNNGNGGASITLDGRTVLVTGKMADDLAEALHPRRQHVADLKDEVAMLRRDHAALGNVEAASSQRAEDYRQRLLAINEALGIACNASQELTLLTIRTIGKIDQWETWASNLLGVDDGTAQELQGLIVKQVKRTEALSLQNLTRHDIIESIVAALKLDPGASKSDIIETIKGLHDDRAKLGALVCGDNDKVVEAPMTAPRFRVGDRVIYGEYSSAIVWTVEQVQEDGKMCHLKREFHPAMVAACTAIRSVPVASLTLTA